MTGQEKITETDLVSRAMRGDSRAFAHLAERHWKTIFMLAYQKTFNRQDAEEITQETFLKAYRNMGSLRKPASFTSWMYTIASQICIDYARRKQTVKKAMTTVEAMARTENENAAKEGQKELYTKVLAQVRDLDEPSRLVVTLTYLEGLSCREIAERLGEHENTIRVRLHRAVKELRGQLKGDVVP